MKNKRSIFGLNYKLKLNLMVLSEIKSVLGYIYGSMRGVLDMTMLRRSRCFALIPVLTMLTVSASAQELTSDVDRSCVGMPIVLTASGFSGTTGILDWTVSTDGGSSWDVVESTLHSGANNIIVPNMPNAENVMYQVVLRNTTEKATVSIGLETDCPDMCHTTTTGEYYMGTDFTPKDSFNASVSVPNDIYHHFNDAGIGFAGKDGASYSVTQDFGYMPHNMASLESNFYYCMGLNGTRFVDDPFTLVFPTAGNWGKSYRFTARLYFVFPDNGCTPFIDESAKIYTRTGHGTTTSDVLEVAIYDDETDELIFEASDSRSVAQVDFGKGRFKEYVGNKKEGRHAYRFDLTFYGRFPANSSGLTAFTFVPYFEQFVTGQSGSCLPVLAIDYISAEVENVCVGENPVCIGDIAVANAAGFPKNANYKWEVLVDGEWRHLSEHDRKKQMEVPITEAGKTTYRVSDGGDPSHMFEFFIIGKNCKPMTPGGVSGDRTVCVADDATVSYTVNPLDANDAIRYSWFIRRVDENGKITDCSVADEVFGIKKIETSGGQLETVKFTFGSSMQESKREGEFKLGVFAINAGAVSDTLLVDLTLKEKPAVSLELLGNYFAPGTSETDKELCPADKFQKIVANIVSPNGYPADKYTFVWSGASGTSDTATVDIETVADRCDPTKEKSMKIGVSVSKDGCETGVANTYKVRPSVGPSINCESIKDDERIFILGPTQSDTLVRFPIPDFSADCDPNPILTIELKGKRTNQTISLGKYTADSIKAGLIESSVLDIRLKSDTIRTTYTVKDGCDSTRTCGIVFIVKDTTAPNIDCELIDDYSTKLSYFGSCEAVPGLHESLPTLVAPELEDRNGSDGVIKGTYLGRFNGKDGGEPNVDLTNFNKKIALNDKYESGNNYILWGFYDFDGNVAYCIQLVRVLDDIKPNVYNCPEDSMIGEIGMDPEKCGLSLGHFLENLSESRVPYAKDQCSSTKVLKPRYFYKLTGTDNPWVEIDTTKMNDIVFVVEPDKDSAIYDLAWRFYKDGANGVTVSDTTYAECIQTFILKDKEGPRGDCRDLPEHNVKVNQHALNSDVSFKYASGKNPDGGADEVGVIYSLAGEFNIPVPVDNCGGEVIIDIELVDPGKKDGAEENMRISGKGDADGIANLIEKLNRYKFNVGVTHVIYTFTDERGNKNVCDQRITVSSKYAPIPDCSKSIDQELVSQGTCKVDLNLNLGDVPTANFPYFLEVRDNKTGEPYSPEKYDSYHVNPISKDMPGVKGYPSKVVRVTNVDSITLLPTAISKTYELVNTYDEVDKVPVKIVNTYDDAGNVTEEVVHEYVNIHLSNFNQLPDELTKEFPTGTHLVTWFFDNGYGDIDSCVSKIVVKDTTSPVFDCSSLDTIKAPIDQVSICETAVEIDIPEAHDYCNPSYIAKGVGVRSDKLPLNAVYPAGITTITWTFTSPYSTSAKVCEQKVLVQSVTPPVFNCGDIEDINVYTKLDACDVTADMIEFDEYFARDYCTNDPVQGVKSREDGKTFEDNYPLGTTKIKWLFVSPYSLVEKVCYQNVIVHDTTLPSGWKCDLIEPRVINVEISTSDAFVPVDDVVKSGLLLDGNKNLFTDPCGDVLIDSKRSDGKALTDNYPLGETTITWTYTDHAGNVMNCDQTVVVGDMSAGEMKCPNDLNGKTFGCYSGLDIKPYETFEEFKLVGGTWDKDEALLDSFWHEDEMNDDTCNTSVKRVYWIRNIRGLKTSCEQEFNVRDEIAPVFKATPGDIVMTCDDYEIPEPDSLYVEDNCAGVFKVGAKVTNYRSKDPSSCKYYNYSIKHEWIAEDACGNSTTHTRFVYIKDTVPPTVTWDAFFRDTTLAELAGSCVFTVPDFESKLKDKVSDNCNETSRISIVQTPPAGSQIKETTTVKLKIFDNCDNSVDTFFVVRVSPRKSIVKVEAEDKSLCITETTTLNSKEVFSVTGKLERIIFGKIQSIDSRVFIDYYKDSIKEENLIFSNNPTTYYYSKGFDKISSKDRENLLKIVSNNQSGRYVFVGMDTVAYCSDTASAYFDFVERPRISLYADTVALCEGDSIAITGPNSFFYKYGVCIDERGGVVDSTAWLLDDSLYHAHQPVPGGYRTLKFYAKNECGESDSKNSLFAFCEMLKATTEDSLLAAGSEENLKLWREDKLYSNDSIVLDVHTRYDANKFILTTLPTDKPRVVRGDGASLIVKTNYKPKTYYWYRVNGKSDGMSCFDAFSVNGEVDDDCVDSDDSKDELLGVTIDGFDVDANKFALASVSDTADYYVLITDSVCPAAQSNVVEIAVLDELPSAITPYTLDNLNDAFMKGYFVMIFNRYGQKVFEGEDGWDGKIDGVLVDPGVYFYDTRLKDGSVVSGTIEVVKIK